MSDAGGQLNQAPTAVFHYSFLYLLQKFNNKEDEIQPFQIQLPIVQAF